MDAEKFNILLVDDRPEKSLALRSVLEQLGENIIVVDSGVAALKQLLRREFALVLMDVQMPVMDGFETVRLIRGRPSLEKLPIIFLTASSPNDEQMARAYSLGAVDFVFAPVTAEIIKAKVSANLELHRKAKNLETIIQLRTAALHESEARSRLFVENATDLAIFFMDTKGKITGWNPGAKRILGWSASEVIGRHASMILTPDDIANHVLEKQLNEAAKAHNATVERWHVRKDGSRFWGSGRMVGLLENGRLIGFAKILRDITEKKQAEEALSKAQRELQVHANNLEHQVEERTAKLRETIGELEAFSYSLSHDLKAPIRTMQGYAHALIQDYGEQLPEDGKKYVNRIDSAALRLDRLISDILAYTLVVRESIATEPVDVEKLLNEIIGQYPSFQPPKARVEIAGPFPKLLGNQAALTQCITNLIANAVKFVAPGVVPNVKVWAEPWKGEVRLWFADNGIGIAPQYQERIFDMFQRVHSEKEYEGTGIGLAIVRKAVERMGGSFGLESEEGKGSRFWIQLKEAANTEGDAEFPE